MRLRLPGSALEGAGLARGLRRQPSTKKAPAIAPDHLLEEPEIRVSDSMTMARPAAAKRATAVTTVTRHGFGDTADSKGARSPSTGDGFTPHDWQVVFGDAGLITGSPVQTCVPPGSSRTQTAILPEQVGLRQETASLDHSHFSGASSITRPAPPNTSAGGGHSAPASTCAESAQVG